MFPTLWNWVTLEWKIIFGSGIQGHMRFFCGVGAPPCWVPGLNPLISLRSKSSLQAHIVLGTRGTHFAFALLMPGFARRRIAASQVMSVKPLLGIAAETYHLQSDLPLGGRQWGPQEGGELRPGTHVCPALCV